MVNDNNLINQKPFEIVQEIESQDEYQSNWLEYFKQAIQSSGVVNKSLFNSLNPESYALKCSWDNPDCPHYLDFQEGYISLYLSCPAVNCGGDGNQYHWKHAQPCGGRMYISVEANLRCMSCGDKGHWREWLFRCWKHKGDREEWRSADWGEFSGALGMVSNLWIGKNPITKAMIDKISTKVMRDKY